MLIEDFQTDAKKCLNHSGKAKAKYKLTPAQFEVAK